MTNAVIMRFDDSAESEESRMKRIAALLAFFSTEDLEDIMFFASQRGQRLRATIEATIDANSRYYQDKVFMAAFRFDRDPVQVCARMLAFDAAVIAPTVNITPESTQQLLLAGGTDGATAGELAGPMAARANQRLGRASEIAKMATPDTGGLEVEFVDDAVSAGGLDGDLDVDDGGLKDIAKKYALPALAFMGENVAAGGKWLWGKAPGIARSLMGIAGIVAADAVINRVMSAPTVVRSRVISGMRSRIVAEYYSEVGAAIGMNLDDLHVDAVEAAVEGAFNSPSPQVEDLKKAAEKSPDKGGLYDTDPARFAQEFRREVNDAGGPDAYARQFAADIGGALADGARLQAVPANRRLPLVSELSSAFKGHRRFEREARADCADATSPRCAHRLTQRLADVDRRYAALSRAAQLPETADLAIGILTSTAQSVPFLGTIVAGLDGLKRIGQHVAQKGLKKRKAALDNFSAALDSEAAARTSRKKRS